MAMMVVLIEAGQGKVSLDPAAASALARLGVTAVAFLRDERSVGVVLEGWAFDPAASADEAAATVAGKATSVRTLRPLMQVAVSATGDEGGVLER